MFKTVSGEGDLGTLTWAATVDPSGTIAKKYKYIKLGKNIQLWFKITASSSGTMVQSVEFDIPSEINDISIFSSQPNDEIVCTGSGAITSSSNENISVTDGVKLFKDGSGNFKIKVERVTGIGAASYVWGHLSYLVS